MLHLYDNLLEEPPHLPRSHLNDPPEDPHLTHIPQSHPNDPPEAQHRDKGRLHYTLLPHYPQAQFLKTHNFGWCFQEMNPAFTRHCETYVLLYSIPLTITSSSARHAMGVENNRSPLPANSRQSANQIFVDGYMARRVERLD